MSGLNSLPPAPITAPQDTPRTFRRQYKKSTKGCTSCKTRKIKCDEARPVCTACKRKYVDLSCCVYPTTEKRGPPSRIPKKSSQPLPSELGPVQRQLSCEPSGISGQDRILELRLLHHYTKTTCKRQTLGAMLPLLRGPMWEIDIPQMAFSDDIVLNALLGISAINLLASQPNDNALILASNTYFARALSKYRLAVLNVGPDNAEPMLVAACIIAHFTWLTAHSKDHKKEPYKIDLATFNMCNGIRTLVSHTKPWLHHYNWPAMYDGASPREEVYSGRFLTAALKDMEALSICFTGSDISKEDSDLYFRVADDIIATYHKIARKDVEVVAMEQRLVTCLHRLPQRFVQLLEQEDAIGMLLLARNMALFACVEDSDAWWIHGSGPNRVCNKAVGGIHGLLGVEWLWAMQFPLKVVSKEITLGPDEDEAAV